MSENVVGGKMLRTIASADDDIATTYSGRLTEKPNQLGQKKYYSAARNPIGLRENGPFFRQRFGDQDHVLILETLLERAGEEGRTEEYLEAFFYMASSSVVASQQAARAAMNRFGSLGAIFAAKLEDLRNTPGISHTMALTVKSINHGMLRALKEPIAMRIDISSDENVLTYLGQAMKHSPKEQLRLLYLDRKNGLIKDEMVYEGTVDHVPLYPREVVRKALEFGASAIIMAHNHPSGDPTPSQQDIKMTIGIIKALAVFDIRLHEHFIIGSYGIERLLQNRHVDCCGV